MKQLLIISIALFFSLSAFSQKDTLIVLEKSDTVKGTIIYLADNGNTKWILGTRIVKGLITLNKAKGAYEWYGDPKLIGYYNKKYKKIDKVIQFF